MSEKKGLYDLNPNSKWVKFFEWVWGVNPAKEYKTMCPYFWSYVFTIVFIPIIVLVKLIIGLIKPWVASINRTKRANEIIDYAKLVEDITNAETDKELYKIRESRCFSAHRWELNQHNFDLYLKLKDGADRFATDLYAKKAESREKIDKLKYGKVGTVLSYLLGAIALYYIYRGLNWLAHLITFGEFAEGMWITTLVVLLVGGFWLIFWLLGSLGKYVASNNRCDSGLNKSLNLISTFFSLIWRGIKMVFDMIANVYRKSCPTIHWDKD